MTDPKMNRPIRQEINGLLLLDKAKGKTSNAALNEIKRLLGAKKAGHTGSLDPIATGLLPICFGEITKLSQFMLHADKRYWTRIRLGVTTTTGDAEGEIVAEAQARISSEEIERALISFRGEYMQIPSMFSAIKVNGQPLYKLAHKGVVVEREARPVHVRELTLKDYSEPYLELVIECSHGFYVRVLAEELGKSLGCGGHVVELRRLALGNLQIAQAHTAASIANEVNLVSRQNFLCDPELGVNHLPRITISRDAAYYLCRGQQIKVSHQAKTMPVTIHVDGGGFIGIGEINDTTKLTPRRLFKNAITYQSV